MTRPSMTIEELIDDVEQMRENLLRIQRELEKLENAPKVATGRRPKKPKP